VWIGARVASLGATFGTAFLLFAHLHLTPEQSIAPVVGALFWLVACHGLARASAGGQARRLVVTTTAVAVTLLAATLVELLADDAVLPEAVAALSFLVTLQCFAATMAEITHEGRLPDLCRSWERTGRVLVAVDGATAVLAVAWATNLVERRDDGALRATDVDLAPVGTIGRVVLVVWALVVALGGAHFLASTYRTWTWARMARDAPAAS
jgi:hypothetical protein